MVRCFTVSAFLLISLIGHVLGEEKDTLSEVKPSVRTARDKFEAVENRDYKISDFAEVGEKLIYQVRWKGIPAGTVALRVKRTKRLGERKALNLEMRIQTNDFLSVIYPVDSTITSLADTEDGRSFLFRRDLREGRRRVDDRLQFDYTYKSEDGVVEPVSRYSKIKGGTSHVNEPRPIPGSVQDSLSVIYYLRQLSFEEKGDLHTVLIGSRKRVDQVEIKAIDFVTKRIGKLGTFDCIVIEPKGDPDADRTNIVSTKGGAKIYLEKSTGVPLYMSVALPFGTATCALVDYKGIELPEAEEE